MGAPDMRLLCLACFALLLLGPALGQDIDSSTVFPSLAKKLACTGMDGFIGANATFEQKASFSRTMPIATGIEVTDRCENTDLKEVHAQYGEYDPKSILPSSEAWTCNVYGNGFKNFTIMDLTILKPDGNRDSKLTCTYDGKPCPVVSETDKEYRIVVGMPNNCTAYVEPTTPAPTPTTTAVPASTAKSTTNSSDCGGLKMESSNATFSPSDVAVVNCTQACCGLHAWETCRSCPDIYDMRMEGLRVETFVRKTPGLGVCTSTAKMALIYPRRERVQVQVMCRDYDGHVEFEYVTFQKRLHSEACRQDVDCLDDLWCVKGRCACPRGNPPWYSNATTGDIRC